MNTGTADQTKRESYDACTRMCACKIIVIVMWHIFFKKASLSFKIPTEIFTDEVILDLRSASK